jgi:transketolase
VKTLREAVRVTKGRLVIVEDHYPEGGLGAAVMEALAADGVALKIAHLGVKGLPTSGKSDELMNAAGISARHVVAAATKLLAAK